MATMKFKQGDTWQFVGYAGILNPAGDVIDITGWTIASQMRNKFSNAKICDFVCTLSSGPLQQFTHTLSDTSIFTPGVYEIDVQFTSPAGVKVSWPTSDVIVEKDITQ